MNDIEEYSGFDDIFQSVKGFNCVPLKLFKVSVYWDCEKESDDTTTATHGLPTGADRQEGPYPRGPV